MKDNGLYIGGHIYIYGTPPRPTFFIAINAFEYKYIYIYGFNNDIQFGAGA